MTASHDPYNRWRANLDAVRTSSSSNKYRHNDDDIDHFSEDGAASVSKIDSDDTTYIAKSADVNAALDKIEQLLSEDEQLLNKMQVPQRLKSPINVSQSLAIQNRGVIDRVNKIERIVRDHKIKANVSLVMRVDDNLLAQKTIQQLNQIQSNMIDRPLLPNPLQFQQAVERKNSDNHCERDHTHNDGTKRSTGYQSHTQILQRKQREISLLACQNKAALDLKKQWQKTTEDARLELQMLRHWIRRLVPLSAELLNPSTDSSVTSAHGQVLQLLEQPNYVNEGMGQFIDKKMNDITSVFFE